MQALKMLNFICQLFKREWNVTFSWHDWQIWAFSFMKAVIEMYPHILITAQNVLFRTWKTKLEVPTLLDVASGLKWACSSGLTSLPVPSWHCGSFHRKWGGGCGILLHREKDVNLKAGWRSGGTRGGCTFYEVTGCGRLIGFGNCALMMGQ